MAKNRTTRPILNLEENKDGKRKADDYIELDAVLARSPSIVEGEERDDNFTPLILKHEILDDEAKRTDDARVFLKKDSETYQVERYKKNAMIIFNNFDVLGGKPRRFTMKDEIALKATFVKFGFIVESHLDLTKTALMQELKTFCSKDFSDYGCVCLVIMTHGSSSGYLRAHDTRYSEHFNVKNNNTLWGKPVVIIIQACRGDEPANAVNPHSTKSEEPIELDYDEHYTLPTESDMLVFHSSYVGRASASTSQGSWFIQTLCEQINLLAAVTDFESICRAVKREVATEKEHNMTLGQKEIVIKQMPVVTTTLLRLLYLRRYEGDKEDETGRDEKICEDFCSDVVDACGCEEYFDYLKRCLRLFITENPDDDVAQSILKIAETNRNINGVNLVDLIRKYLSRNTARFTQSDVVYLGRPCCNMKQKRIVDLNCCSVV